MKWPNIDCMLGEHVWPTSLVYEHLIHHGAVFLEQVNGTKKATRPHKKRGGRKPGPSIRGARKFRSVLGRQSITECDHYIQIGYSCLGKFQTATFTLIVLWEHIFVPKNAHLLAPLCIVSGQPIHSLVMYWWGRRCSTWALGCLLDLTSFSWFRALIPMER